MKEAAFTKVCPNCNIIFERPYPTTKFCSRKCYLAYMKDSSKHEPALMTCQNCNKTFETHYRQKRYCSQACKDEHMKLVHINKSIRERNINALYDFLNKAMLSKPPEN